MERQQIRPLVKYHGGKGRLHKWIVPLLPEHDIYVEPFGGAASVLLNKGRVGYEFYGDVELRIVNLMRVVRDECDRFLADVREICYDRSVYALYRERYFAESFWSLSGYDRAIITYVVRRMSRGGLCGTFCWSDRRYSTGPAEVHCWRSSFPNIRLVSDRLAGVEICEEDAFSLMSRVDGSGAVFYLDPPYLHSTRNSPDLYVCEMGELDHIRLLGVIRSLSGRVLLSGYRSPLYDMHLRGWWLVTKDTANHSSHRRVVKERKVECLYCNFPVSGGVLVE